jgi:hypothetical protein
LGPGDTVGPFAIDSLYAAEATARRAPINRICIAVRRTIGVAGLLRMVRCSRAARMFAGNIASRRIARQIAAGWTVRGIRSPMAPRISRMPVIVMMAGAPGKAGGTHADEVGAAGAPVGGGGEEEHQEEGDAQGEVPVIEGGDAEEAGGSEGGEGG